MRRKTRRGLMISSSNQLLLVETTGSLPHQRERETERGGEGVRRRERSLQQHRERETGEDGEMGGRNRENVSEEEETFNKEEWRVER